MESWRKVWRETSSLISTRGLEALREALVGDFPELAQGVTITPHPLPSIKYWPVEAACPLAYTGWKGNSLETVGECEEYFARLCFSIDQKIGEPAGCRWFLNWVDETPRKQMREQLLSEVEMELENRKKLTHEPSID